MLFLEEGPDNTYRKFKSTHPSAGTFYYLQGKPQWSEKDEGGKAAVNTVRRYHMWAKKGVMVAGRCCCPRLKVYLFGYSRGGARAAEVANLLDKENISVFFLGMIEPAIADIHSLLLTGLVRHMLGDSRPGKQLPDNIDNVWEAVASEDPTDILESVVMDVTIFRPDAGTVDWTRRDEKGAPIPYMADHDRIGWESQPEVGGAREDVKDDLENAVLKADLLDERAARVGQSPRDYLKKARERAAREAEEDEQNRRLRDERERFENEMMGGQGR